MNKIFMSLLSVFCFSSCVFGAESTENINSSLKASTYEPNYFSILVSLIFVILLIYITGILYTKLNKFGLNTVKKEFDNKVSIKPIIISTTPISRDKFLQVIEISGERLLIGVSQNSVNLIKSLGNVTEKVEDTKKEINKDTIENKKEEELNTNKQEKDIVNEEELGLYKKYLR